MQRKCKDSLVTSTFVTILASLLAFGILYNQVVAWLETHGKEQGNTAWLVVVGVAVTGIAGWPLYGLKNVFRLGGMFVASGTPMLIGGIYRHWKSENIAREAERRAEAQLWRAKLD